MTNLMRMDILFEKGRAPGRARSFLNLLQLPSVLPPQSTGFFPEPYKALIVEQTSPISECNATEFECGQCDADRETASWETLVVIPFIDEKDVFGGVPFSFRVSPDSLGRAEESGASTSREGQEQEGRKRKRRRRKKVGTVGTSRRQHLRPSAAPGECDRLGSQKSNEQEELLNLGLVWMNNMTKRFARIIQEREGFLGDAMSRSAPWRNCGWLDDDVAVGAPGLEKESGKRVK